MKPDARTLLVAVFAGCLASCSLDNPVGRSLSWFSYLDAADIRDACAERVGERYRLIYNAVWGQQVRSYDIVVAPNDGSASLAVRVFFPENLNSIDLSDPLALYRGRIGNTILDETDLAAFREALRASAFDTATPRGLLLPSDGYYWVVAACRDGVFHYNAYLYPSAAFAGIRFDRFLLEHDPTGVAFAGPGPSEARRMRNPRVAEIEPYSVFDLTVGANGLVGVGSLF